MNVYTIVSVFVIVISLTFVQGKIFLSFTFYFQTFLIRLLNAHD